MSKQVLAVVLCSLVALLGRVDAQKLALGSCQTVLQNYFTYLTKGGSSVSRSLYLQATFIQQDRYVAYYSGSLSYAPGLDALNGSVIVSFSDRSWTPACNLPLFCPSQNFHYQKTDTQTITISRLGAIRYTLNSWGNAQSTDQLQCYAVGAPMFTSPTVQTLAMFVMTLKKQEYAIPR